MVKQAQAVFSDFIHCQCSYEPLKIWRKSIFTKFLRLLKGFIFSIESDGLAALPKHCSTLPWVLATAGASTPEQPCP
jgi:hypothetical protein